MWLVLENHSSHPVRSKEECDSWSYTINWSRQMLLFPEWGKNRTNDLEPIDSSVVLRVAGFNFCCLNPQSCSGPRFCSSSVLQPFMVLWIFTRAFKWIFWGEGAELSCWYHWRGRKGHEIITRDWCSGFGWMPCLGRKCGSFLCEVHEGKACPAFCLRLKRSDMPPLCLSVKATMLRMCFLCICFSS